MKCCAVMTLRRHARRFSSFKLCLFAYSFITRYIFAIPALYDCSLYSLLQLLKFSSKSNWFWIFYDYTPDKFHDLRYSPPKFPPCPNGFPLFVSLMNILATPSIFFSLLCGSKKVYWYNIKGGLNLFSSNGSFYVTIWPHFMYLK